MLIILQVPQFRFSVDRLVSYIKLTFSSDCLDRLSRCLELRRIHRLELELALEQEQVCMIEVIMMNLTVDSTITSS